MGETTEGSEGKGTVNRSAVELEAALDHIRGAPQSAGRVELLVRRPGVDQREVCHELEFDPALGVVGDNWQARGSRSAPDGAARVEAQVTLMGSRAAAAIAGEREAWPLAGDQVYVDLDLSQQNVPAGTRLVLGTAVLEVSELPHTGCAKFAARFGRAALAFVNTPQGRALNLRGVNARIVTPGRVAVGDIVRRAT